MRTVARRTAVATVALGLSLALGVLEPAAPAAATPSTSEDLQADIERLGTEVDRLEIAVEQAVEDYNAARSALDAAVSAELAAQSRWDRARGAQEAAAGDAVRRIRALYRSGPVDLSLTSAAVSGRVDLPDLGTTVRTARGLIREDESAIAQAGAELRASRHSAEALIGVRRLRVDAERVAAEHRRQVETALAERQGLLDRTESSLVEALERDRLEAESLALAWALADADPVGADVAALPDDALRAVLARAAAEAPDTQAGAAVTAAASRIGTPYLWGATGPHAFDCSGLVVWAYARAGVAVPRTSRQQHAALTAVPVAELRPGDLVFYASGPDPGSIHHVGLYVGSGLMLHAPRTGDVVRLAAVDRRPVFAAARPRAAA